MKFLILISSMLSLSAFAQYNQPNIVTGQPKELFKTEIQLGGESFYSENLTQVVPFGTENNPRFHAIFNESGIKIGNQEFSAKLLPLTVKLTANSDEKWDEANLKTLAQRIRGEVARFFFHPDGSDLFINAGTIAFDYKKIGPQALHPAGVEVTQMDIADLNIGYRLESIDGKWQMIFSGYAAVQMVNVHDDEFIDHNEELLGKNVAGTYGLSLWGNYKDAMILNVAWYHQQSKLSNRDFVEGDNLNWSHQSVSAGLEVNLGKVINKKLAPISLMMKYNYNLANINDKAPGMMPIEIQKINQQSFEVGIKFTIGGGKKKKQPKYY
ncbi:MAG: hypothetical protein ACOYL6_10010 [Bacteriovoracaceae bacterium]